MPLLMSLPRRHFFLPILPQYPGILISMFSKHPAQTKVYVCRLSAKAYHFCLAEKEQSHGKDMVSLHKFQIPLLKHLVLQHISLTFNFPLSHAVSQTILQSSSDQQLLQMKLPFCSNSRGKHQLKYSTFYVAFYSHLLFSALPELYTCFLLCSLHDEFITKRNVSVHDRNSNILFN